MAQDQLTQNSIDYIESTPLEKRKKLGQYMTPKSVYDVAIANLPLGNNPSEKDSQTLSQNHNSDAAGEAGEKIRVFDPAVGTGELLLAVRAAHPNVELYGWDIDKEILKVAEANLGGKANLTHQNGLHVDNMDNFFDAAIVNPPYFEFKPSRQERENFKEVVKGRPNIYAFFIKKTIDLLKEGGHAAFIVPPSMNNGAYFSALRDYIITNTEVKFMKVITDSSLFVEAQTSVQVIVLQKKTGSSPTINEKYVLDLKKVTGCPEQKYLFSQDAEKIRAMWKGKTSLAELGYDVTTGTLIWNEYADKLSEVKENSSDTPVYYSKDISPDGKIVLNEKMNKRRYLSSSVKTPSKGEAIIVNRIVGSVGNGVLKAAVVSGEYFAENHVNVIKPLKGRKPKKSLEEIHKFLTVSTELGEYLQLFTGNTQISATELKYFIPVDK